MTFKLTKQARESLLTAVSDWCNINVHPENLDECELLAAEVRDLVGQAVLEAGMHSQEGKPTY